MAKPKSSEPRILARNRKALHDYEVLESVEAGIQLTGAEVKSARQGRVQLKESHVEIIDGQAYLLGAHISPYSHSTHDLPQAERRRKLLLHRRQIDKFFGRSLQKGLTVVPLSMYLKGPWIKLDIALVQGKKLYDKRQAERRKTLDAEARDAIKQQRW